jgi:hypothetical protein
MADLHRIGNANYRGLDLARHLRGGANRLPGLVERFPDDGAIGRGVKGAVEIDFQCELGNQANSQANLSPGSTKMSSRPNVGSM